MASDKDLRIVLVGKTGAGKSSTGNTMLGRKCFQSAVSLQSVTKTCESGEMEIGDHIIKITDTPGLFDTEMSEKQLKAEVENCIYMSVPGPHAFLLVIRLDVRFTDEERNTVRWIQENFGEAAAQYTIVLFTHHDQLRGISLDDYIKRSNDLMAIVHSCGHRIHSFNNKDIENRSQVTELLEKIEKMVEENGGQHYTNEMYKEAQKKIKWKVFKDWGIKITKIIGAVAGAAGGGAGGAVAVAGARRGAVAVAVAAVLAGAGAAGAAAALIGAAANTRVGRATTQTITGVLVAVRRKLRL